MTAPGEIPLGTETGADGAGRSRTGRIDWDAHRAFRRRGLAWGTLAAAGLGLVYVAVLALANSLQHAISEFLRLWPWMTALVLGFALQVGLFAYAKAATSGHGHTHAGGVAASGGTSTLSMVACCAHHLTDVLPALGLAGAAMFLAAYQTIFLLVGVLSNLVGLTYVLGLIRKHGLFPTRRSALTASVSWPVDRALPYVLGASLLALLAAFALTLQ